MPKDVDSRPKTVHFSGTHVLEFKVMQERGVALSLRFQTKDQALSFRKGFRIGSRHELQKFEFDCEWMTAGAAFFTPWQFFARTWAIDEVPMIGYTVLY